MSNFAFTRTRSRLAPAVLSTCCAAALATLTACGGGGGSSDSAGSTATPSGSTNMDPLVAVALTVTTAAVSHTVPDAYAVHAKLTTCLNSGSVIDSATSTTLNGCVTPLSPPVSFTGGLVPPSTGSSVVTASGGLSLTSSSPLNTVAKLPGLTTLTLTATGTTSQVSASFGTPSLAMKVGSHTYQLQNVGMSATKQLNGGTTSSTASVSGFVTLDGSTALNYISMEDDLVYAGGSLAPSAGQVAIFQQQAGSGARAAGGYEMVVTFTATGFSYTTLRYDDVLKTWSSPVTKRWTDADVVAAFKAVAQ